MSELDWLSRAESADLRIHNIIDGEPISASSSVCEPENAITKHSARDGRFLYQFAEGTARDVDDAVASARAVFDDGRWSGLPVSKRAAVLMRLAALVEENKEAFALHESLDVGKPIAKALTDDIARTTGRLRDAAGLAPRLETPSGADLGHFTYLRRRPVGVVGGIVGWNYPLAMAAGKIAPALIMGNSIVLKPSEFTSLSTQHLAMLAIEAGMPPGVFNVVHGAGHTVGAALSGHMDVDLLAFVGGSVTGKRVMAAAGASNMKRVILECGGKSPFLVFDDCPDDLDAMAQKIVALAFPNQGALCVTGSRLVVQRGVKERLLPLVLQKAAALKPGDPLDPATRFGAIMNEAHMHKVLGYIEKGKEEGADLLIGGERVFPQGAPELEGGFYIPPTIFDNVPAKAAIAQEEIFGPVLSVFTFDTEEEAISLANDTSFGLAAYAATTDLGRAQRLGAQINSGNLIIYGTASASGGAPVLGSDKYSQSGFGHSGGVKGLEAFTTTTTVSVYT